MIIMPADTVSPDVIVCGTGWQPSYHKFLDQDLTQNLGLASTLPEKPDKSVDSLDQVKWFELEQAADDEICHSFPRLHQLDLHCAL